MKVIEGRVQIGSGTGDGAADEATTPGTEDGGSQDNSERGQFVSLESFLAELDSIAAAHDAVVQAFDARYVAGREHLRSAVDHAQRAIDRGENVADSPAVEILLYAAGRRQIDRAMEMGVEPGDQPVVVVAVGNEEAAAAAAIKERLQEMAVEPDPDRIRSFFEITDAEARATDADLEALVLERVALLDVEK